MYGRRYQQKRGFKRVVVTLLSLVMLLSVCFPGLRASAEGEPDVIVTQGMSAEFADVNGVKSIDGVNPEGDGLTFAPTEKGTITVTAAADATEGNHDVEITYTCSTGETVSESEDETSDKPIIEQKTITLTVRVDASEPQGDKSNQGDNSGQSGENGNSDEEQGIESSTINSASYSPSSLMTGATTYAANPTTMTLAQGESGTVTVNNANNATIRISQGSNDVTNTCGITVTKGNNNYTIAVGDTTPAGTYTITWVRNGTTVGTLTLTVTESDGTIRVLVYVAAYDTETEPMQLFSQEMLDLLNINTQPDAYGYYPVGEIYVNRSIFNKTPSSTGGYLLDDSDYALVMEALADLNPEALSDANAANRQNKISEYRDKIIRDFGAGGGSQKTGLFKVSGSTGYTDNNCDYHLDIRFSCNRVIFKTGNNGISSGEAADGTQIDSRLYITGSIIQEPSNGVNAPEGYKVVEGYYADPDCTIEWDKIGDPLEQNEIVYVKIVPLGNAVIEYKVAEGQGSVTNEMDSFNPVTGTEKIQGSTAVPDTNWEFDGWYSDSACTTKVSSDLSYKPTEPADGWKEDTHLIYYAKFVQRKSSLTISKTFDGLDDVQNKPVVTVCVNGPSADNIVVTLNSGNNYSSILENLIVGEYTITEQSVGVVDKYELTDTKFNDEDGESYSITLDQDGTKNVVTVTNFYQKTVEDVTITKMVTGNMGDREMPFDFTVTSNKAMGEGDYTLDETCTVANFSLSHGDSIVLKDVPIGAALTIVETNGTPYTMKIDGKAVSNHTGYYDVVKGSNEILIENYHDVPIDTGIVTDSMPFFLLLAVVGVVGGALLLNKRRYTGKF